MKLTDTFREILQVNRHSSLSNQELAEILTVAVKERDADVLSNDTPESPLAIPGVTHLLKESI